MTKINLTYTLTSPFHHGAGSAGNSALLRLHEIALPDGTQARVPFLSANSIRHGLREALAWHFVKTLEIPEGALNKATVDLLWSGGAISTTGAQTDLSVLREAERLAPFLPLLGFAALSDIYSGSLRASDLELISLENTWRMPEELRAHPHAKKRAAAFRDERFGTRHDIGGTRAASFIDLANDITGTQMIYEHQTLKPGAMLYGSLVLSPAATESQRKVLEAAIALWAPDGDVFLGARSSTGFGAARLGGTPGSAQESLAWWTDSLKANGAEALEFIKGITQ